MKLSKSSRRSAALPVSLSTISLPPTPTLDTCVRERRFGSISTTDLTDFGMGHGASRSKKGKANTDPALGVDAFTQAGFSFSRMLSFGRGKGKGKSGKKAVPALTIETALGEQALPAEDLSLLNGRRNAGLVPAISDTRSTSPISPLPPLIEACAILPEVITHSASPTHSARHGSHDQRTLTSLDDRRADFAQDAGLSVHSSIDFSNPRPVSMGSSASFTSAQSTIPLLSTSAPSLTPRARKLVKRRTVSAASHDIELVNSHALSSDPYLALPLAPDLQVPIDSPSQDHFAIPLVHPSCTEPPHLSSSSLERNPSSSTQASSLFGPSTSTEESTALDTPRDLADEDVAYPRQASFGQVWDLLEAETGVTEKQEMDSYAVEARRLSFSSDASHTDLGQDNASSASTLQLSPPTIVSPDPSTPPPSRSAETILGHRSRLPSVTFDSHGSIARRRPSAAIGRARSASLGGGSMATSSMYSTAEILEATPRRFVWAQTLERSPGMHPTRMTDANDHQTPGNELGDWQVDSGRQSIEVIVDPHPFTDLTSPLRTTGYPHSHRRSTSLCRPPPPPPHLDRRLSLHQPQDLANAPPLYLVVPASSAVQPRGPSLPSRSSSIGSLWRRLSTSSKKSRKSMSATSLALESPPSPVKPAPMLSPTLERDVPETPMPATPKQVRKLARKASQIRARTMSFATGGKTSAKGVETPCLSPATSNVPPLPRVPLSHSVAHRENSSPLIGKRNSSLVELSMAARSETEPTPVFRSVSTEGRRRVPSGLPITERKSSLSALPLTASPLGMSGTSDSAQPNNMHVDYIGIPRAPRLPRTVTFDTEDRTSNLQQAEGEREKRRRYRQTLVEIQDDHIFQRVLEDLAQIESRSGQPSTPMSAAFPVADKSIRTLMRTPSKEIAVKHEHQQSIRAWFVTREIVQGERRHGRLLARGVATVQAAAESLRGDIPPLPLTFTTKSAGRLRRRHTSMVADPIPVGAAAEPSSPLSLLLDRLPRLLALSLTLSSRFEHDPSPHGVAAAFTAMEEELASEIGLWASEVGNLVAMGLGELLDSRASTPSHSRRGSAIEPLPTTVSDTTYDPDERLGFGDIIITPITRALRYKLLFQELSSRTPTDTPTRDEVSQALEAAERLAAECDKRQTLDLNDLRRGSKASQSYTKLARSRQSSPVRGAKDEAKTKKRPRSVVPSPGTRRGKW